MVTSSFATVWSPQLRSRCCRELQETDAIGLRHIASHQVARQLLETSGGVAVVVNAAAPGKESKGFSEVLGVRASRRC